MSRETAHANLIAMRLILGIDVGGTFTDLCLWDGRAIRTAKTPSTPDDFVRGILAGMELLGLAEGGTLSPATVDPFDRPVLDVVHGSTVATNALLERKGERVAFIATAGFEDLLRIGRQDRPELYSFDVRRPPGLVATGDCYGVSERLDGDGRITAPLDESGCTAVLDQLVRAGVRTAACCLLFSYLNPVHELRVVELGAERGIRVFASSIVQPEFREYERASTTVVNAYVAARMEGYLGQLEPALRRRGVAGLRVMQSNGGQTSAAVAGAQAVRTILSGPAGGVVAALNVARTLGLPHVLTYDMGGTSTDVALCDGEPATRTDSCVGGLPIAVPMLAIHTVGAGGGSIARLDAGGALRVGPESAGADPGPACYGRSQLPTVTDANVVLGRIRPECFLGGRMAIDAARSHAAMAGLGATMGCDAAAAAMAVISVCNAGMEHALAVVSAQQGRDPAEFHLLSFGGAGGLHACALAESLGMAGVIVPGLSGVFSACGLMRADTIADSARSLPRRVGPIDLRELQVVAGELMDEAFEAVLREGYDADDGVVERSIDLRYRGQSHELNVPVESLTDLERLLTPFHALHQRCFGFSDATRGVEAVTLRARARIPGPPIPQVQLAAPRDAGLPQSAQVWFDQPRSANLVWRDSLTAGECVTGPALLMDGGSTTLLPPGWGASVHSGGHLILSRRAEG